MASRTIAIKIDVNTSNSVSSVRELNSAMSATALEQAKISHLQDGLTNSFLKGNLAARAISIGFSALKDSATFAVGGLANLELTLAKVQAATGANIVGTEKLSDTVFKLGRETSSSVSDISKASLELAKLGFSGKNLEIVLAGVSRLSTVLGDSLESTGQLVGGVVNTFDLSAEQAATVADKLFVATGKSAASIDSFRVAFGLAGNVAANAGVSFEELSAVIATLSNQGIRASTIGTGLRTWITNLSIEGSKAQKVLGGSFEEMGLLGSMEKMAKVKPGAGTIFEMFGKPGSAVATAMERSTDTYKDFLKAVQDGNGTLAAGGAVINDTLIGSITRLQNSFLELLGTMSKVASSDGTLNFFSKLSEQMNFVTDDVKDQTKFNDFIKKHIDEAKNAKQGMQNAANELGFKSGDHFTDDEFKSAFLRREQQNKVRNDAYLAVAKSLQKQEALKAGIGVPDDRPTTTYDFKADKEAEKLAKKLARDKAKADAKPYDKHAYETGKGSTDVITPEMQDYIMDPLNWEGGNKGPNAKDNKLQQDMTADVLKFWNTYNTHAAIAKRITEEDVTAFIAFQGAVEGVNGSVDILSHYFVEGVFSDKKDPFKHISDAFGDFAKKLTTDLVALTIKVLIFKGVMAALTGGGVGTGILGFVGGLGQAVTGFKFASGTDQVVTKPTMFMAGESGKERVTVTPRAKMGSGGGGITVNIQGDVMDGAKFTEAVEMAQRKLRGRSV